MQVPHSGVRPTEVLVGHRIHWDGDVANQPKSGTVVHLRPENHQMDILWDEKDVPEKKDRVHLAVPVSLLNARNWWLLDEPRVEGEELERMKFEAREAQAEFRRHLEERQRWYEENPCTYLPVAEVARLVRKALREAFPTFRFSVRSSQYAGGADVTVRWTDGPTQRRVENVVGIFEGSWFDGMQDLKCYLEHWELPDGTFLRRDKDEFEKPHPDAKRVHFSSDSIHCERKYSPEFLSSLKQELSGFLGEEVDEEGYYHLSVDRDGRIALDDLRKEWGWTLIHRLQAHREVE